MNSDILLYNPTCAKEADLRHGQFAEFHQHIKWCSSLLCARIEKKYFVEIRKKMFGIRMSRGRRRNGESVRRSSYGTIICKIERILSIRLLSFSYAGT